MGSPTNGPQGLGHDPKSIRSVASDNKHYVYYFVTHGPDTILPTFKDKELNPNIMKINFKVENLGQISSADFRIRPLTVITGPNGTGKTFVTKILYSTLNIINKNVFHELVTSKLSEINIRLDIFIRTLSYVAAPDREAVTAIQLEVNQLSNQLATVSNWDLGEYLTFAESMTSPLKHTSDMFDEYVDTLKTKKTKFSSIARIRKAIQDSFISLIKNMSNAGDNYPKTVATNLQKEFQENFQISDIKELVRFGEKKRAFLQMTGL